MSAVAERIAGRFEIVSLAGEGGMSRVFRAVDLSDGKTVAVKVMHRRLDEASAARFSREARVLANVSHPAIVRHVAHGTAEGKIRWVSAGAFTTDEDNKPVDAYYKARCSIDAAHFTGVPSNFQLIPGMTLNADINVGTRSVAMYLMDGVLRGFSEAMREP